jgi:HSP20 family protein
VFNPGTARRPAYPPVNVWHNAEHVVMTAEIPGVEPADLDVTATKTTVTLKGRRGGEQLQEGETFYRQERPAVEFERTVELPFEVDPQSSEATYEKGVLTLRLRRPEEHKPQKITIKAG